MADLEEIKTLLNRLTRKVNDIQYDVDAVKNEITNISIQTLNIINQLQNLD